MKQHTGAASLGRRGTAFPKIAAENKRQIENIFLLCRMRCVLALCGRLQYFFCLQRPKKVIRSAALGRKISATLRVASKMKNDQPPTIAQSFEMTAAAINRHHNSRGILRDIYYYIS
jgi:hypothetical protein